MRVFISFASRDREVVRQLEASLRIRRPGVSFFFDERALAGGVYWIPRLGEELGKADVVLLLLGETVGPWQELEYYQALQLSRQGNRDGRPRIIPVVIADRPSPGLAFLATLHQIFALDPVSSTALSAIEQALSAAPTGEAAEPWRRFQPYKGLPALSETDAAFFFGREKETNAVLDLLARSRGRIVTLIGQSGVGKSSLVSAGVLSRLKSQLPPIDGAAWSAGLSDSRSYIQLKMSPGRSPVKELAVSLVKLYGTDDVAIDKEASDWTQRFRDGSHLYDMLRLTRDKIAERQGGYPPKRFVLYVDQGEELYTPRAKEGDEARLFSRLLADAAESETFLILMSMRSDFYSDFQNDDSIFGLSEKFDVRPLTRDVLIDVIRKPAEVLGACFEDVNIPSLIADATREPGALPLLSDLLQEMWLNMLGRGDGVLRWSDQPGIVDIGLPLKRRADAFLEQPKIDSNVVRRLFTLRLAQVTQVGEPVRRRSRRSECTPEEWSVAAQLAASDQRLLTISNPLLGDEPIVEVAHEQLLQRWPRLRGWLNEQREFLIWRTETELAALAYDKLPEAQKPDEVLMGLRLTGAEVWFKQRAADLTPELRDYVKASIVRRDELLDRKKWDDAQKIETKNRLKQAELDRERHARATAEKAHELERARAQTAEEREVRARESEAAERDKAAAARKLSRVSFAAAIVLAVLAIFAIGAALLALNWAGEAGRQQLAAVANESRALAALSRTAINRGLGADSAELALAAWPRNATDLRPQLEVTLQALAGSLAVGLTVLERTTHDGPIRGAQFSRDESRILSWSYDQTLRLWDAATGTQIGPAMKHEGTVRGAHFSRDESHILSWSYDQTLRLWDAATGTQIGPAMKHEGPVDGALFSRDESRILSWSNDGTLRLWDAATGAQIGPAMKHEGSVFGAQFSRDESRILSWSYDGALRLWNAATGAQIGPAMKHGSWVYGAQFSRDESRILSWSDDGTLRLWDAATGTQIGPAMKHEGRVNGAQFSRDESHILSWSYDGTLRLWDAATGTQIGPAMKHEREVNGAQFSRDESRILSWSDDKTLRLWDAATGTQIGPAMKHEGSVFGAQFSRDESRILSWSYDWTLRLWDAATGTQIGPAMKHEGSVFGAQFSRDESRILSWSYDATRDDIRILSFSYDGTLRLWDAATGAQIGPAMKHEGRVYGAQFSRDDIRILSFSYDGTLRLWDAATGAQIGPAMKHEGSVYGAQFSRDDIRILSWSDDGTLRLWDAATGAQIGPAMKHEGSVFGAQFSRDESRILSWSLDGTLRLWDAATGAQIGPAMKHGSWVYGAQFSRDESRILSWSEDGTLRLWDAATGAQIGPAMKHEGTVRGAHFSRDESHILSWSYDGTLRLWDAATGTQIGPAMKHEREVNGAQFSRDESRILSWSEDGTLRLWDAATGAQIGPAMKHEEPVRGAQFSRDESRILSWSQDLTLRLWDAATGTQIGPAMKHVHAVNGAQFSRDESRILSWSPDGTLRLWDAATGTQIGPAMKHEGEVKGAQFSRDESRILSWSEDGTLRLWNAAWIGRNLFEIVCNHTPQTHDLARLSDRYGARIADQICEAPQKIPVPDWSKVERAPR